MRSDVRCIVGCIEGEQAFHRRPIQTSMPTATEMSMGALMKFGNGLPGFRVRLPFSVHMSGDRQRPRPRRCQPCRIRHGFRAKQHIFDIAKAFHGPGTDLAAQWGKIRRNQLDRGRLGLVIGKLAKHASRCPEAERNMAHFGNHRA